MLNEVVSSSWKTIDHFKEYVPLIQQAVKRTKHQEKSVRLYYNGITRKGEKSLNWTAALQNAIDYMEDHLTETLDYAEIAKCACSSSFHFQRVFGIVCGYTLGEYIRNRRLTLAGSELVSSDAKVIDVALKYGYDSPESFARAFVRFHGITPSQAKSNAASLKSFSRLSVKLVMEGGNVMDYRIEKKGPIQLVAHKERFQGGDVGKREIHALWNKFWKDGTIEILSRYIRPGNAIGDALVGICFDNPEQGDFDYAIGVAYGGGELKDTLSFEEIPANTWAIFPCVGRMPEAFQSLWKRIYTEFFPTSEYQPSGGICLEVYPSANITAPDYTCEFWISVAKK